MFPYFQFIQLYNMLCAIAHLSTILQNQRAKVLLFFDIAKLFVEKSAKKNIFWLLPHFPLCTILHILGTIKIKK